MATQIKKENVADVVQFQFSRLSFGQSDVARLGDKTGLHVNARLKSQQTGMMQSHTGVFLNLPPNAIGVQMLQ